MNLIAIFSMFLSLLIISPVNAADQMSFSRDSIYLNVATDGPTLKYDYASVLLRSGWKRFEGYDGSGQWPFPKDFTYCSITEGENTVDIDCYTPHPGHAITVRNGIYVRSAQDLTRVPALLDQLIAEHGKASRCIGIAPR